MEEQALRVLIRTKLADGRLPHDSIPRLWGGPANGETCDACDEVVPKVMMIIEGISAQEGSAGVQFHVRCFQLWDSERQTPGHETSEPGQL